MRTHDRRRKAHPVADADRPDKAGGAVQGGLKGITRPEAEESCIEVSVFSPLSAPLSNQQNRNSHSADHRCAVNASVGAMPSDTLLPGERLAKIDDEEEMLIEAQYVDFTASAFKYAPNQYARPLL